MIGKQRGIVGGMSFLMVEDSMRANISAFAKELIPSDGHPMTHPNMRDWCVCDNYPDLEGCRDLFLFNLIQLKRIDIGRYRRLFETPDMSLKEIYFDGVDKKILASISEEQLAFTRSGLHCDLHPRWSANGKWAVFDSIHEGTRQIYKVDVSDIL